MTQNIVIHSETAWRRYRDAGIATFTDEQMEKALIDPIRSLGQVGYGLIGYVDHKFSTTAQAPK